MGREAGEGDSFAVAEENCFRIRLCGDFLLLSSCAETWLQSSAGHVGRFGGNVQKSKANYCSV